MTDAIKFGKKAFTWSVVLMTVAWSMGVSALVPLTAQGAECPNLSPGDLIQIEGDDTRAVYLLNDSLERMAFPNGHVYKTWFNDFSGLSVISPACGEAYSAAGGVNYRPGSWLVRFGVFPKLYFVGEGNMIHWITSEEVALSLFGTDWNKRVSFVLPAFEGNYSVGADLTEAMLKNGMLVKVEGSDDVWYVSGGERHKVDGALSEAAAGDVRMVSQAVADTVPDSGATVTPASVLADPAQGASAATPPANPVVNPGSLSVALAADTPASAYGLNNSTRVGFTKINLTAGADAVTIDSMLIQRTGSPAGDSAFTGVNIIAPNGQLLASSYKGLNADHQATFTEDVVVPANSTVSLLLVGKLATTGYGGELPRLSLVSMETDASVSGSLPIEGNAMTLNETITVGVLTVANTPTLAAITEEVGTTDVEFLNVKLSNDSASADLRIDSIRFNNVGSASDSDVEGLELVVDGNVIATSMMKNNYVSFDLAGCAVCALDDGRNETFLLRGDIIGGSGRTLDFDVKVADDIVAYDLLNGTNVTPSASINGGRVVTISRGTLNVSKTNDVPSGNISEDTNDVELGSWNFRVAGEPITVKTVKFDVDLTTSTAGTVAADFTNLKLVDANGKNLTGATDATSDTTGDGYVSFTDSFTLPIGDNVLKIVGNLSADFAVDDTVQFAVDFSGVATTNLDATGDVTGDAIVVAAHAFPNAEVDASTMTVKTLTLDITTLSQVASSTIAAGSSDVLYSKIRFDAGNAGEDIKVTNFTFTIDVDAISKTNEVQNIRFVVDGTELGITKDGSTSTVNTDEVISVSLSGADQFVIPKGNSVVMEIRADLSAGSTAAGTHRMQISTALATDNTVTAQGAISGNDVTETVGSATARGKTVGAAGGKLQVALDSDNPSASLVAAGTEVNLAAFNFHATSTEDVEIDYITLTQLSTVSASSSYSDIDELWFVDAAGNEIAGTRMSPTSTSPYINFANKAFVVNVATTGETLYLKAKLAAIGTGFNGVSGHRVGYYINAISHVAAKGDNTGAATTEYFGGTTPNSTNATTHYMHRSYPKVEKLAAGGSLANGSQNLFKFKVTAVNGDISLYKLAFGFATTTVRVVASTLQLYDVTDDAEKTVLNSSTSTLTNTDTLETFGSQWTTNFSQSKMVISSAKARTYELRGNLAGAASGSSISVGLAGDASVLNNGATAMLAAASIHGSATDDDFIWSDQSADGHSVTTADWTNGYLVQGLPSTTTSLETYSL